MSADAASLRSSAPWRVLNGFGRAVNGAGRYVTPRAVDDLAETLEHARAEGLTVAFRGAGRSYGDVAINTRGLIIDMSGLNRLLRWEPSSGLFEAETGLTIEGLWRRTIADGFWPPVVPGTMTPTLGGCLAANVHGKNAYRAGPFGEHVLEFDLLTAGGDTLRCTPDENADLFRGVIGGFGLLGAVTRVKLRLERVASGRLEVTALHARGLDETLDLFERHLPESDYLVGWIDGFGTGRSLGRGALHAARYLAPGEDVEAAESLKVERQGLPCRILGFPRAHVWRLMRPLTNDPGMALVNAAKYRTASWTHGHRYRQSHAAFAFLLDYVPEWRLAYGPGGFIQQQLFVPDSSARLVIRDALRSCHRHGMRPYLAVLKRHRSDGFSLSYAVDGWSLALDFRVTQGTRERLQRATSEITESVLEAGGRFYFAKDSLLKSDQVRRALGAAPLRAFLALKRRVDPDGLFASDLSRRALGAGEAP